MHGHDLAKAASSIGKFINAEEDLREKAQARKNSIFSRFTGADTSDFEEFMALEDIETKKQELREILQLYGRAGMYNDWVKYQTEARKKRKEEKERQQAEFEKLMRNIGIAVLVIVLVGGLGLVVYVAYYLKYFGI